MSLWSSESIEPGFNLSGLVARTRCGRNQSVTFEELLAATGVVWARRPAGEVTVCFKTTTAAPRDVSSAAASSAGIRTGEFSSLERTEKICIV